MKYPKGTTEAQWQQYEADCKEYEQRLKQTRPVRSGFQTQGEYDSAYAKWMLESLMDQPNKPGYFRANND